MISLTPTVKKFFQNPSGKVVLFQTPNVPLLGWIIFKLLSWVPAEGQLQRGCALLSTALLFTWAYLEITSGTTHFRRLLGLVVLLMISFGFFQ